MQNQNSPSDIIPFTLQQQDIYYDQLIYPHSPLYNIGAKVIIDGQINIEKFRDAYLSFILKHDILNYELFFNKNLLYFKKNGIVIKPLNYYDFSESSNSNNEANKLIDISFKKPFQLIEGAFLFDITLIKISNNKFILYAKYHHILLDGWGTSILFQYLVKKYNEIITSIVESTSASYCYSNYALENLLYASSSDYKNDKNYWCNHLKNLPEPLFTTKWKNKSLKSLRESLIVDRNIYNSLDKLAKKLHASTFHLLLAILSIYIGKYYHVYDFIIGLPINNRNKFAHKKTAGLFMGVTPLRVSYSPESSLEELVSLIRNQLRSDYRHQRYPLGKIIQDLSLLNDREKLFNLSVSYEKHDYSSNFFNTETLVIPLTHQSERTALSLYVREFDIENEVIIDFDYNTDYFDLNSIESLIKHFNNIMHEILIYPNQSISEINILSSNEKDLILNKFNDTYKKILNKKPFFDTIDLHINTNADKIAINDGSKSYSYKQVKILSDKISIYLRSLDYYMNNKVIAVILGRSADMILILLGILKSGRAYLPLDPNFPTDRLIYMLNNSGANLIITDINDLSIKIPIAKNHLLVDDIFKAISLITHESLHSFITYDSAYIIYTSGSTGNPKGVEISHDSLSNFLMSMKERPGIQSTDVLFSVTTYSFDISLLEFFLPLYSGATLYIANSSLLHNTGNLISKIVDSGTTVIQATPSFFQSLYNFGWEGNPRLKVLVGGDLINQLLLKKLLSDVYEVWNMYGPTETTVWSSVKRISSELQFSNIGTPIHNTKIFILDYNLKVLPIGSIGDIYIAGKGLAKGYYNQPDLTKEKFIPSPFVNKDYIYKTGDVGRWNPKGEIEFLGRSDNQVKVRGYRIELSEIEKNISEIQGIKEAVVIAKENGNQDAFLVAYIVSEQISHLKDLITEKLSLVLPKFMIPRVIVNLEHLPKTPNNKIDRKFLTNQDIFSVEKYENTVLPKNENELVLQKIWGSIFGVETISTEANFFELGGHSLKALSLADAINKYFNVSIGLKEIFEDPTIQKLAYKIDSLKYKEFVKIPKALYNNISDITSLQYKLWHICQDERMSISYNMHITFKVDGNINIGVFNSSINSILDKHNIIRSNFKEIDGKVYLIQEKLFKIFNTASFNLNSDNELQPLVSQLISVPYNLENDLLIKFFLINTQSGEQYLVFVTHHLIFDGISLSIFIKELVHYYNNGLENSSLYQEEKSQALQFSDYVHWKNKQTIDESISLTDNHKESKKLNKIPITFIRDRKFSTYKGNLLSLNLGSDINLYLEQVSRNLGITKYSVLLSTVAILIYKSSGLNQFNIGIPISGRNHPDLSEMIGLFIQTIEFNFIIDQTQNLYSFLQDCSLRFANMIDISMAQVDNPSNQSNVANSEFDVMVTFQEQNFNIDSIHDFVGFDLNKTVISHSTSRLPITFSFMASGKELCCEIEYDTGLFDYESIFLISEKYRSLIKEISLNNNILIGDFDLETDVEKKAKASDIEIDFDF